MALQIENLHDLLKDHIKGQIINQKVSRLTAPGENYGSLMLKVDITVKNNDKEETIYAVAKCVPPNKEMQVIFNIQTTFKNEIGWYRTVIPTMLEYQKEQGVKNIADFFLDIYGSRLSLDPDSEELDDDGVILMENLAVKGYFNADRRTGFNLEQSKEILKKLATFHAIPLALRLKKPEVFDRNIKKYLHKLNNTGDDKSDDRLTAIKPVLEFLKGHPETSPFESKVRKSLQSLGPQRENVDIREPWASVIHTDFWVNNIMIKEEEGKPTKVIILDLQTCGYGSPVEDLLFFLGTSVQTDLAKKHFDDLIKLYYIELMENLKFLNADTTLFPYGSFLKELELHGSLEYAHCMFFVAIVRAEKSKSVDSTDKDFNPLAGLMELFANITDKHEEQYIFLTKEFAKRNWI